MALLVSSLWTPSTSLNTVQSHRAEATGSSHPMDAHRPCTPFSSPGSVSPGAWKVPPTAPPPAETEPFTERCCPVLGVCPPRVCVGHTPLVASQAHRAFHTELSGSFLGRRDAPGRLAGSAPVIPHQVPRAEYGLGACLRGGSGKLSRRKWPVILFGITLKKTDQCPCR